MRKAISPLERFLVTPTTSKHRVFAWLQPPALPDHQLIVFARSDDCWCGILQSRIHEVWARAKGTQLREAKSGSRYTPTTTFETFPFPDLDSSKRSAIATAAGELETVRNAWLNPPEWFREESVAFRASADGPWARLVEAPDANGIGTVRHTQLIPVDDEKKRALRRRSYTNLYNDSPAWLKAAHGSLDEAVFAAYGWDPATTDDELLALLLKRNLALTLDEKLSRVPKFMAKAVVRPKSKHRLRKPA